MNEDLNLLIASANELSARRRQGANPNEATALEVALRRRIDEILTGTECVCPCGEGPATCECRRCSPWFYNRMELESAGVYVELKDATEIIPVALGDVEAFAGVLARLIREGERGSNFVVAVARGSHNAFVQFAGSPREETMLWEASAVDVVLSPAAEELLVSFGFAPPEDGHSAPNYRQEPALGDDRDATLIDMTLRSFRILREVYGCGPDTMIDMELHIGAWAD